MTHIYLFRPPRCISKTRLFLAFQFVVLVWLLTLSHAVAAQTPNVSVETSDLMPGQRVEAELRGGQFRTYSVKVKQGEYVRLDVEQQGIDVIATLRNPQGAELAKVNLSGEIGRETISYIAEDAGEWRLEIRARYPRVMAGRYTVLSMVKATASSDDKLRITAERSLARANEPGPDQPRLALELIQQSIECWNQLGEKYWQAYALNQLGFIYRNLKENTKALDAANEALRMSRGSGDLLGEATALFSLGTIHSHLDELPTAKKYFEEALKVFELLKDREYVAITLEEIGRVNDDSRKPLVALTYFHRALKISRLRGYTYQEAVALTDIGEAYTTLSQHKQALRFYKHALPVWREANDKEQEAIALSKIGYEYSLMEREEEALSYYQASLSIFKTIDSHFRQSETLEFMANAYSSLGVTDKAIDSYLQSAKINHSQGADEAEARTLKRVSEIYADLGNHQEALHYSLDALALWKGVNDRPAQAKMLDFIADEYRMTDSFQLALEHDRQALALWRELKNREREANTLRLMGGMYWLLSQKREALNTLLDALAIYQSERDHGMAAQTLSMIGVIYYFLGERKEAWNHFEKALPLLKFADVSPETSATTMSFPTMGFMFEEYEDILKYYQRVVLLFNGAAHRRIRARALTTIAEIYLLMDNAPLAMKATRQALSILHSLGDRGEQAFTLNQLGKIYLAEGASSPPVNIPKENTQLSKSEAEDLLNRLNARRNEERENARRANEIFQRARSLFQATRNQSGEGAILMNIARVHQILDDDQAAFEDYSRALSLLSSDGYPNNEIPALYGLMDICTDMSNPEMAIIFGKRAVNQLQYLRSAMKLLDKNLERAFTQMTTDVYRDLASLLIRQGRLLEAERVIEMLKEEEFFRFVRGDAVADQLLKRADLSSAEVTALERYNKISERIVAIGEEFGKLEARRRRLPPRRKAEISSMELKLRALDEDLQAARATLSLFLDQLKQEFGEQDKRIATIEEGLLPKVKSWKEPQTVVVSTVVGKDSLSMVLTTPNSQKPFVIKTINGEPFSEQRLSILIGEFRSAIRDTAEDPRPSGQKLYDLLIKPLEEDLQVVGANTIVWSLDGSLRYLPIAALYDSKHGYLVERYATVIITLASNNDLASSSDQENWQVLGLGVSKAIGGFPALSNVREELRAIVRETEQKEQTGLLKGRRLLDEEFTSDAFRRHLGHYNVIHAATHFSFKAGTREEALESFLLLGSGEKLTLAQIRNSGAMFSGVELLVLSACDTAAGGRGADGREIEGFGVLAQRAGAQTVMATQWPVADSSTRELMVRFYEIHGSRPKVSKAEALRQAQLALLRGAASSAQGNVSDPAANGSSSVQSTGKYSHPYYWGPFILIGNWK